MRVLKRQKVMNKFLVAGLLLFIVIAVLIWNLNRKKRGTVVLGTEMGEASEREKQRLEAGTYSQSPLPDFDYSK